MRRRAVAVLATALAAAAGVACSSGQSGGAARPPAPSPAPVVTVTMHDFRFELDRDVPAGRVVFRAINAGKSPHNLTMIPLPDDVPPIAEQLRGTQRRLVEPFAGIYEREAGDTGTFAVDLAANQRYAMICSVPAEDGEPHWMKGMASEFRARGASPGAARPLTSSTAPSASTG